MGQAQRDFAPNRLSCSVWFKAPHLLVLLLTAMWMAVIVSILDLATARLGNIRTDPTAYEWTRQSFAPPAGR